MKYAELYRLLKKHGWVIERTKKHHIFVNSNKPGVKIPVGKHANEEVPKGTLNSILKAAGLK